MRRQRGNRLGAFALALLMAASGLVIPAGAAQPARDAGSVLQVTAFYEVSGDESWMAVVIASTGTLRVPAGASLTAGSIELKDGALEIMGGEVRLQPAGAGEDASISGKARDFIMSDAGRLVLTGADGGNASVDASQGGDAYIQVSVSGVLRLDDSSIEARGGRGFGNSTPWAYYTDLAGYCSAGGNASLRFRTGSEFNLTGMRIVIAGGDGGKAADGRSPSSATTTAGATGGGYCSGGWVYGYVGSGGAASLNISGSDLRVAGSQVVVAGGRGGRAGDGGGLTADSSQQWGGGGGGGYSGGKGGGYIASGSSPPTPDRAWADSENGGQVSDFVGAGGPAWVGIDAQSLAVAGLDLCITGGSGGDGGNGGVGNYYSGGGGGGYGGGGGGGYNSTSTWYGTGGNGGLVSGRVGSGGDVAVELQSDLDAYVSNLMLTAAAGNGGNGGKGGLGGQYGGGGGGGYGGGGGGGNAHSFGGLGQTTDRVASGGNVSVELRTGPLDLGGSRFILLGGNGGKGGTGGKGGNYGGGGGGGYGGSGGGRTSTGGPGAGTADGFTGCGGGVSMRVESRSDPGELVCRKSNFYMVGGEGGSGGLAGEAGSYSGGGGGGYAGCGGTSTGTITMPPGTVGPYVASGGNAAMTVSHPSPSITASNRVDVLGGKGGTGKTQAGAGTNGGAGTGITAILGNSTTVIPMGVVIPVTPRPGEILNAQVPTFEWEPLLASPAEGDVGEYLLQVDNESSFTWPDVDAEIEQGTSFTPTTELAAGGHYLWKVKAVYITGKSYGWGPEMDFSLNTPPVYARNVPVVSFDEDTIAYRIVDLNRCFTDDLYPDALAYAISYESDPAHVLCTVDGQYLTFTSPVKDWYGNARFAVRATDGLGLSTSSNTFTVRVLPVNDPPVILPLPDQYISEGTQHVLDLAPYIYDVDTGISKLNLTVRSGHTWAEGLLLHLDYPEGAGSERVDVSVSDGEEATHGNFTVHVGTINAPPELQPIAGIEMQEDETYILQPAGLASDRETPADKLVWSVTDVFASEPPIFECRVVDGNTIRIVGEPNANGQGSFRLVVADAQGAEASRVVWVNVTSVNDPPVIADLPIIPVSVGSSRTVDLRPYLSDVDTPMGKLNLTTTSPLAVVSGLILNITVGPDDAAGLNETTVQFSVFDGTNNVVSALRVRFMRLPSIPAAVPDLKLRTGGPKTIDLSKYGSDGDTPRDGLTWEVSGGDGRYARVYVAPDRHMLVVIPLSPGKQEIVLTLKDSDGNSVSQVVTVNVEKTPEATGPSSGLVDRVAVWAVVAVVGVAVCFVLWRRRAPAGKK